VTSEQGVSTATEQMAYWAVPRCEACRSSSRIQLDRNRKITDDSDNETQLPATRPVSDVLAIGRSHSEGDP